MSNPAVVTLLVENFTCCYCSLPVGTDISCTGSACKGICKNQL